MWVVYLILIYCLEWKFWLIKLFKLVKALLFRKLSCIKFSTKKFWKVVLNFPSFCQLFIFIVSLRMLQIEASSADRSTRRYSTISLSASSQRNNCLKILGQSSVKRNYFLLKLYSFLCLSKSIPFHSYLSSANIVTFQKEIVITEYKSFFWLIILAWLDFDLSQTDQSSFTNAFSK